MEEFAERFAMGLRHYVVATSALLEAHKRHPVIELGKVTLCALALRQDIRRTSKTQADADDFPKRHPFATWLSTFLTAYAGSFIACFLMGESVIKPICNPNSLMYCTVAWYIVFYSPYDFVVKSSARFPLNLILALCSEIYRIGNISSGVRYTLKSSLARDVRLKQLLMILVGTAKGCGSGMARTVVRVLRFGSRGYVGDAALVENEEQENGQRRAEEPPIPHDLLVPSYFTKLSVLVATVFSMLWLSQLPTHMDYAMISVSIHFFVITQRVLLTLVPDASKDGADPFSGVEDFFCKILFGKAREDPNKKKDEEEEEEEEKEEEKEKDKKAVAKKDKDKKDKDKKDKEKEDIAAGGDGEGVRRRQKPLKDE